MSFSPGARTVVLCILLLLVAPASSAAARSPSLGADSVASDVLTGLQGATEARDFREGFGLMADPATILTSLTSASYDRETYGVPLTRAEISEIERQFEVQSKLAALLEKAEDLDGYVGAWLQPGSALVEVATHGDTSETAARLRPLLPSGVQLGVQSSAASLAELRAKRDRITGDWDTLTKFGVKPTMAWVNPARGRVEVGVEHLTAESHAVVTGRYGPDVDVVESPPIEFLACSINDCGTVGGVGIVGQESGFPQVKCTSGFLIKENNNPGAGPFMATAGHCIQLAGGTASPNILNWKNYNSQSITWGKSRQFTMPCGGSGCIDFGYFALGNNVPADKNNYFVSPTNVANINLTLSNAGQVVGISVCRSGWGSWERGQPTYGCGAISRTDFSWPCGTNCVVAHAWQINLRSYHGDSGAGMTRPIAQGRQAAGILSGGSTVAPYITTYTTYGWASSVWLISACTTSSC